MGGSETSAIRTAWAVFAGTNEDAVEQSGLVSGSRIRKIEPGTLLIEQGDEGGSVFLVLSGSLKAVWYTQNGHEIWLSDISRGEIVGEFSALSEGPRSSSVVSNEYTELVEIPIARFRAALDASNSLTRKIATNLAIRIQATSKQVIALVGLPLAARLHAELQRIGNREHSDSESVIVNEPPTVSQLAEKIHASREATSRAFSILQKRGLVYRENDRLQVIVPNIG